MNRKDRMKKQVERNKRNTRKMELNGYRRLNRMVPVKSFDLLASIIQDEARKWEMECGR